MNVLSVYITPEDIIDKLCDEDRARFNRCVFTDVHRGYDGSVTIDCLVFNDPDQYVSVGNRQRFDDKNQTLRVDIPRLDPKR